MEAKTILFEYAMRLVGLPYRWGGDDAIDGFDCSGLTIELLKAAGVAPKNFDTTASGLWEYPAFSKVGAATFGTLCFYGVDRVTHVGFCLTPELMLEAGGGGSTTTSKEAAAKQNAYVRVRPIKSRQDFVGFRQPTYAWGEK